jgi:twitching motility protein PilT
MILQRQVNPYSNALIAFGANDHSGENNDHHRLGDVPDFSVGVRGALRMAVDGMMIMEIRDDATAEAAIRAARNGMWVVAGLHADSPFSAIQLLIDMAPEGARTDRAKALARHLHGIHYQKMLPSLDGTTGVIACESLDVTTASATQTVHAMIAENRISDLEAECKVQSRGEAEKPYFAGLDTHLAELVASKKVEQKHASSAARNPVALNTLLTKNKPPV